MKATHLQLRAANRAAAKAHIGRHSVNPMGSTVECVPAALSDIGLKPRIQQRRSASAP